MAHTKGVKTILDADDEALQMGIQAWPFAIKPNKQAGEEKKVAIKIETRGAVGIENALTEADIAEAHAVIIAADMDVAETRFAGKPVAIGQAIKDPGGLIDQALALQPSGNEHIKILITLSRKLIHEDFRKQLLNHLQNYTKFYSPYRR